MDRPVVQKGGSAAPLGDRSIRSLLGNRRVGLVLLCAGAAAMFAAGSVLRLRAAYGLGFDLGFYLQQVWLLSEGVWQATLNNRPVFADHLSPILYLFAPFGGSHALAAILVTAQALAVGLTLWPLLARPQVNTTRRKAAVALYFVASPALGYAVLFDFHPMLFGLPLLAAILNLLERRGSDALLATLVVSCLLIREDVAFLAGLLVLVLGRRRDGWRLSRITAMINVAVVLGYVVAGSTLLPRFALDPTQGRFDWIGQLLSGNLSSLMSAFSGYVLVTILVVYAPVLIVPALMRLPTTHLAALVSLFFMLGDFVPSDSIYYQYQAIPVMLVAWGLGTVMAGLSSQRTTSLLAASLALALAFGPMSIVPPPTPVHDRWLPHVLEAQERGVLAEVRDLVPADASVSASNTLGPFVAQRERVFDFPDPLSCEGTFTPSRGVTSFPDFVIVTDLETDQEDVDMIEGFGYLPVARIYDATVYEAPPHPPTGKMCLDES